MDKKNPESPTKKHKPDEDTEGIPPDSMESVQEEMVTDAQEDYDAEKDETDFRNLLSQRRNACATQTTAIKRTYPLTEDEMQALDTYNMKHPRRGVALIFNHEKFLREYQKERLGADEDGRVIEETLRGIGFEVHLHTDKTSKEIYQILSDAAKYDHKDCDCILIAIMTHGREGGILAAYDGRHKAEDVCSMFTSDKVKSLAGKPKIFLFQACRGKEVEKSSEILDSADAIGSRPIIIPSDADFLVAHSSIEGYRSFRNKTWGSWFIQALCEDLKISARRKDFLSILTDTLRRVSYNRFTRTPKRPETHNKQEMPIFSSTLTRRLFFYDTKPETTSST